MSLNTKPFQRFNLKKLGKPCWPNSSGSPTHPTLDGLSRRCLLPASKTTKRGRALQTLQDALQDLSKEERRLGVEVFLTCW